MALVKKFSPISCILRMKAIAEVTTGIKENKKRNRPEYNIIMVKGTAIIFVKRK